MTDRFVKTAALVALGCKVNQSESRQWSAQLARIGVELVEEGRPADLYIVNTCTVTHLGDKSSRQAIRRASRTNPDGYVVVTGCYATVDGEAVAAADALCERERLLTLASPPEVRILRAWMRDEVRDQIRTARPPRSYDEWLTNLGGS